MLITVHYLRKICVIKQNRVTWLDPLHPHMSTRKFLGMTGKLRVTLKSQLTLDSGLSPEIRLLLDLLIGLEVISSSANSVSSELGARWVGSVPSRLIANQYLSWPSDSIWQHRSGPILAWVMACCCLTATSPYLNQYWLTISEIPWQLPQGNLTRNTSAIIHPNWLENYLAKILFKSPWGQ